MSMLPTKPKIYDDGMTKQSFKDETDINKILSRAQKTGTISHLAKYQGVYADFSDFDFETNLLRLTQGREIFDDLPSEIRKEFSNSPAAFFAYVNDPANAADITKRLPALAAPGKQNLDVRGNIPADELAASQAAAKPATPATPAQVANPKPSTGSQEPTSPPADPISA